jgi:hypothetical protein
MEDVEVITALIMAGLFTVVILYAVFNNIHRNKKGKK